MAARRIVPVVATFLCIAGAARPAPSSAGRVMRPLSPPEAIAAVRGLYAKVSRYTAAAGTPVRFAVRRCRAIYSEQFERQVFSDLFDLPAGRVLDVSATTLEDRGLGLAGARYRAHWTEAGDGAGAAAVAAATAGESLAEVLSRFRQEAQDARALEPIVSCEVTASAEGESRQYRAAFFFGPEAGDRPVLYADHIVSGLEHIAAESLPAVRDWADLRGRIASPDAELTHQSAASTTSCVSDSATTTNPAISLLGVQEHYAGGSHSSSMALTGTCTETVGCISQCSPSFAQTSCTDLGSINTGMVFSTHKTYSQQSLLGDSQFNAASYCQGGLACAVESCRLGLCSGISFTVGAGTVKFTVSGGTPLWNGSLSDKVACAPPIAVVPRRGSKPPPIPIFQPPIAPGTGGGGGTGVGGTCSWVDTGSFSCTNPQDPSTCTENVVLFCS